MCLTCDLSWVWCASVPNLYPTCFSCTKNTQFVHKNDTLFRITTSSRQSDIQYTVYDTNLTVIKGLALSVPAERLPVISDTPQPERTAPRVLFKGWEVALMSRWCHRGLSTDKNRAGVTRWMTGISATRAFARKGKLFFFFFWNDPTQLRYSKCRIRCFGAATSKICPSQRPPTINRLKGNF